MSKTYKPKPEKSEFERSLQTLEYLQKRNAKSKALVETKLTTFTKDGILFIIRDLDTDNNYLRVVVDTYREEEELLIEKEYFFVNPPVMYPNGTFRKAMTSSGEKVDVENFEFNPIEALKEILAETIKKIINK